MKGAIRSARAFGTWDSDYPADIIHLPSGLRASLCAYSNGVHELTRFPGASDALVLGPRTLDASEINVRLAHGGTSFDLRYQRNSARGICGSWQAREFGEWGLRFWVLVCVQFEGSDATDWRTSDSGILTGRCAQHWVAVAGERASLLVTFHQDLEALRVEYETHGYWYLESRDAEGPLAVLRYNFEEMREFQFALGIGDSEAQALKQATAALDCPQASSVASLHEGRHAQALDAVRDVVGWNTVYDEINQRPYTSLSRNWSSLKFGGFGVWLDDVLYHGLLSSVLDREIAVDNLRAALAGATEAGNLPCLLTGRDAWIDRSQPPIATFVLWLIHLRWGDLDFLRECYPVLLANHEWWWRERDGNNNGLLEYGTSPVGRGAVSWHQAGGQG